ncbi:hypothetical protein [Paenibacillus wulumuqiensis]|uniref:hypothetical protein n=1 Tax=Paenibacillus wulumuqiensis TaxID=1567107 RepID=UPI000619706E|nr:hypothetical protein [Paenibacillus wulumuqiensis]
MRYRYTSTHLLIDREDSVLAIASRAQGYASHDELSRHTHVLAAMSPEEFDTLELDNQQLQHDPAAPTLQPGDRLLEKVNMLLALAGAYEAEEAAPVRTQVETQILYPWLKNYTVIQYVQQPATTEVQALDWQDVPLADEQTPEGMTALAQYFAAHSMWLGAISRIRIQAGPPEMQHMLHREVLPHFEHTKQHLIGDQVESFSMYRLWPQSREWFEQTSTAALPIVRDLYRHHDSEEWYRDGRHGMLYYLVDTEQIEPYDEDELEHLRQLIRCSYLEQGDSYAVTPLGWQLEDSLRHSVALRFLASITPFVRLCVDGGTGRIILIELFQSEPAHPVLHHPEN